MKKLVLGAALMAVASLAVASFASADVARYQQATGLTVTSVFNGVAYTHTYSLTNNPLTAPARSAAPAESIRWASSTRTSPERSVARTSTSAGSIRTATPPTPATPGATTAR